MCRVVLVWVWGIKRDFRQTPVSCPARSMFCAKTNSTVRECHRGEAMNEPPGDKHREDGTRAEQLGHRVPGPDLLRDQRIRKPPHGPAQTNR